MGSFILLSFSEAVTCIQGQSQTWCGHTDDGCAHDTGKRVTSITYVCRRLRFCRNRLLGRNENGSRER